MLVIASAVVIGLMLAMPVPDGRASEPVAGGRYVDRNRVHGTTVRVKLTLANDGKEFAIPSFAIIRARDCTSVLHLDSSDPNFQPKAVPVLAGGRFRYALSYGIVRGHFTHEGRVAVGRIIRPRDRLCRRSSVRFRAPLAGTPNAARPGEPSRCDRVSIRFSNRKRADNAYEPIEHGFGCTTARELARAWDASGECASLPGPGPKCTVGDAVCERIVGGAWRPRASVRCSLPDQPANAAEFVYQEPCRPPPYDGEGDFYLWAINLDCPTARSFPIDEFIDAPNAPCGSGWGKPRPDWCTSVAGYSCAGRSFVGPVSGYNALCVLDVDPFKAFRLAYDGGI